MYTTYFNNNEANSSSQTCCSPLALQEPFPIRLRCNYIWLLSIFPQLITVMNYIHVTHKKGSYLQSLKGMLKTKELSIYLCSARHFTKEVDDPISLLAGFSPNKLSNYFVTIDQFYQLLLDKQNFIEGLIARYWYTKHS